MKEEPSVRMKNNFYAKHSFNGRSRRVDTKGEDLTECSYYRGVRITVKRLLASTPILYRHPYMKDVKLVLVKTGFA